MKKKVLILSLLAICAVIAASGTLAYYTVSERAHSVITTGSVNIEIEEWQDTGSGWTPYPSGQPIPAMPGVTVSKIATVRNKQAESYIRAKFDVVITDADGEAMELPAETLEGLVRVRVNDSDWTRKAGDDQWWYYTAPVARGAATEPLFTQVVFDGPNMTSEYQRCGVQVIVSAQAVQTANNGADAAAAKGWPEA